MHYFTPIRNNLIEFKINYWYISTYKYLIQFDASVYSWHFIISYIFCTLFIFYDVYLAAIESLSLTLMGFHVGERDNYRPKNSSFKVYRILKEWKLFWNINFTGIIELYSTFIGSEIWMISLKIKLFMIWIWLKYWNFLNLHGSYILRYE